ncbi:MAG: hypothetical protein P1U65_19220 [Minwuia sp.]|nr:hypothetical protein [Minwuia sp.]
MTQRLIPAWLDDTTGGNKLGSASRGQMMGFEAQSGHPMICRNQRQCRRATGNIQQGTNDAP